MHREILKMFEKAKKQSNYGMENETMKKRIISVLLMVTVLTASTLAGCSPKVVEEVKTPAEIVETEKKQLNMELHVARIFTAIKNEPVSLLRIIDSVDMDEGLEFQSMTIDYLGTSFTLDVDADVTELEEQTKDLFYTLAPIMEVKVDSDVEDVETGDIDEVIADEEFELLNGKNVPNLMITFTDVVLEGTDFEITYTAVDVDNDEVFVTTTVTITVVPEVINEISEVTDNLKISNELENYSFDTRASNINQHANADSNIKNVTVKTNDVVFTETGSYDVIHVVELEEPIVVRPMPVVPDITNDSDADTTNDIDVDVIEVPVDIDVVEPTDEDKDSGMVIDTDVEVGEIVEPTPEPERPANSGNGGAGNGNVGNGSGNSGSGNSGNGNNGSGAGSGNAGNGSGNSGNTNSGNTGNNNTGGNTNNTTDPNAGKTWVEGHYATREVQKTRQVDNWVDEGKNETVSTPYTVWIISQTGEEFTNRASINNALWAYDDAGFTHYTEHSVVRYKTTTTWVPNMVNRPKTETYTETEQYWVAGHWK